MKSEFGNVARNLCHAGAFTEQAVQCGAKVVLLPEFMPSGYAATEEVWDYAETISGQSVSWLLNTAKQHHIYLGFTFIECEGEHFYNTFVLSSPDGMLLGRVRKNPPCSRESYYFKAGSDAHIIETELGRIGIGICYENLLFSQMRFMLDADVVLMLLPAAAGRPVASGLKTKRKAQVGARSLFMNALGVPAVIANMAGTADAALPENLPSCSVGFPSSSSIMDGSGHIKAQGGEGQGVIIGEVNLGGNRHHLARPRRYLFLWAVPVPWHAFIWWLTQKAGEYSYSRNPRRKVHTQESSILSA
jgi:N-carbamoylputrescine amidase